MVPGELLNVIPCRYFYLSTLFCHVSSGCHHLSIPLFRSSSAWLLTFLLDRSGCNFCSSCQFYLGKRRGIFEICSCHVTPTSMLLNSIAHRLAIPFFTTRIPKGHVHHCCTLLYTVDFKDVELCTK